MDSFWILFVVLLAIQLPSFCLAAELSSRELDLQAGNLCDQPARQDEFDPESCELPIKAEQDAVNKNQQAVDKLVEALQSRQSDYQSPLRELRGLKAFSRRKGCLFKLQPIDMWHSSDGETALAAAVRSGDPARVQDVIDAVKLQGGQIDARNAKGCTALELAYTLSPENPNKLQIEKSLISAGAACDPSLYDNLCPKPASVVKWLSPDEAVKSSIGNESRTSNAATSPGLFDLISFHAASIMVPDAQNAPVGAPKYMTDLINQGQGASISAKGTNGNNWGPTIAGDMRIDLYATDNIAFGSTNIGNVRLFADVAGDLNKNDIAKSLKNGSGLLPNWIAYGVGSTQTASVENIESMERLVPSLSNKTPEWFGFFERVSYLQNRLYAENLYYWVESVAVTAVVPLLPKGADNLLPSWVPLRPLRDGASPAYLALTAESQFQQQRGSGAPGQSELPKGTMYSVESSYRAYRADLYAYPCGLWTPLMNFCTGVLDKYAKAIPITSNQVSIHLDYQNVVPNAGHFFEWSINAPLIKYGTLSLTRTVGVQDPLMNFGVVPFPPRATVTSLQFKTKVSN